MFGVEAKVGLTSSSLPDEIISKISTEDDLKDITNTGVRNDFDIIEITDVIKSLSHKTLYKKEVINTFIYFCKQDLDGIYYCTFFQPLITNYTDLL
jgi:hypothetical protein